MTTAWRRMATAAVLAVAVAGCSSKESTAPDNEPPNVGGLLLSVTGGTNAILTGALPTPDLAFTPPVLSVSQTPTTTVAGTISVSAAEPFTTVLVLPAASASYMKITLPAATQSASVKVLTSAKASAVSTAVTIAVGSGTRTSRSAQLSLLTLAN